MKEYAWVIAAGIGALIAFMFFVFTLSSTTSLIKKLKKRKLNIGLNMMLLFFGISNIGIAFFLILSIRDQIDKIS